MDATWLKRAQRECLISNPTSYLNAGFYNLLTSSIPLILKGFSPISAVMHGIRYEVTLSEISAYNDGIHLSECFHHNLTYRIPITAKVQLSVAPLLQQGMCDVEPVIVSSLRMPLFYLPIPTGPNPLRCSALTDPDPQSQAIESGIFVIDGHMRTCPGSKQMINNTILTMDNKAVFAVHVRSSHEGNRTSEEGNPFRPTSSIEFTVQKLPKRPGSDGAIVGVLPYSKKKAPIGVLVKALGCDFPTFLALVRCVAGTDYDTTVFRCYEIHLEHRTPNASSQTDALLALSRLAVTSGDANTRLRPGADGKTSVSSGTNLLKTEIFPHLNIMYTTGNQEELYALKVLYLAIIMSTLVLFASGKIKETSRDMWQYASILLPSFQIGSSIKKKIKEHKDNLVKLLRRGLQGIFKKKPSDQFFPDLREWWGEARLSGRIQYPIATGNFSRPGEFSSAKQGITMSLIDNNPMGTMNQLQRTSASMRKTDGTNTTPRKLPRDAYRGPCAAHTPEGASVGLVTSWACTTKVTLEIEDPKSLILLLEWTLSNYLISIFQTIFVKGSNVEDFKESLASNLFRRMSLDNVRPNWYIFINNCGVPTHFVREKDVNKLIRRFRDARRAACIPRHCFLRVTHHPRQIRVICEGGQIVSPLIVLDNLYKIRPKMSFQEMIVLGIVEYMSVAEEYSICKVALSLNDLRHAVLHNEHHDITHMEFEPAAFLGFIGASVLFATSQPGARTSYAIHQWKQIISAGRKPYRGNILCTELMYNSAKLVHTRVAGMSPMSKDGYGKVILCALIPDTKSQEDAFKTHRQANDRGLNHCLTTRYYSSEIQAPTMKTSERFEKPKDILSKKEDFTYDAIDDDTGLPKSNYFIPGGHPIFAKTRCVKRPSDLTSHTVNNNNNSSGKNTTDTMMADDGTQDDAKTKSKTAGPKNVTWRREVGICTQPDESGIINQVNMFATRTGVGLRASVVTSREMAQGNKITNDGANKGTNSENCSSKDAPWIETTGEIPGLIIAPTSIISRMLMSTVTEGFIGYAVTLNGDLKFGVDEQQYDGQMRSKLELAAEVFVKSGHKRSGGAIIRCGKTGRRLKGQTATIAIYYRPLIHFADKKLQFRSKGPRHTQTRQPLTGRRKKGATRFGELESAATTAQGAAAVLLGRLRDSSDPFEIFVCANCSNLATGNKFINYAWCHACERRDTVYIVKIAFIFLYNYYERLAMGNKTLIHIKPHNHRFTTSQNNIPTASFCSL